MKIVFMNVLIGFTAVVLTGVFIISAAGLLYYVFDKAEIAMHRPKIIELSNGLICIKTKNALSCNWEKYNTDTKNGEFPYAVGEK